jgi:transcriptional regulator with XRE-family HTH domain
MEVKKMTFGEKLRNARLEAGYTQEELASKLIISRAAIAKWESDRGMPDVKNLKALAGILNVSVDYLLDDGNPIDLSVTKKAVDLGRYGDQGKLSRLKKIRIKEKIIREEYPDAKIIRLTVTRIKNTKAETAVDQVIGWTALLLGGIPLFGTQEMGKTVNSLDHQYYLVNEEKKQYFVLLTDEFMISRLMPEKLEQKKFCIEDREFLTVGEVD